MYCADTVKLIIIVLLLAVTVYTSVLHESDTLLLSSVGEKPRILCNEIAII
jgi:hypothetical protein